MQPSEADEDDYEDLPPRDSYASLARTSVMSQVLDENAARMRPSITITDGPVIERSAHRERLQKLVKDFARTLTTGMQVTLLVSEKGGVTLSNAFLLLDRQATILTLKPERESDPQHDFPVLDISSIYQGTDVCVKSPSLGEHGLHSVGMDINGSQHRFFFYFEVRFFVISRKPTFVLNVFQHILSF